MDPLQKCLIKWGDKYEYHSTYKKYRQKISFTCKKHGKRDQSLDSHLLNGCYCCYKTIDKHDFVQKSMVIHGNKFNYDKVEYLNSKTPVVISCKEHGDFLQTPNNHLQGNGCSKCLNLCTDTNSFIIKSEEIHDHKYYYSKVDYVNNKSKVIIICPDHGEFYQSPNSHLQGKGCVCCQHEKMSIDKRDNINSFISKSILIHGDLYDYSKVVYQKSGTSVIIGCKIHGYFKQRPDNHINKKYGCPKCGEKCGKMENSWLDMLNVPIEHRQVGVKISDRFFKLDAYEPEINLIYEFYGDYWHGNPKVYKPGDMNMANKKTFGELYSKTMERENYLKSLGYKIISIWESDFNKIKIKL